MSAEIIDLMATAAARDAKTDDADAKSFFDLFRTIYQPVYAAAYAVRKGEPDYRAELFAEAVNRALRSGWDDGEAAGLADVEAGTIKDKDARKAAHDATAALDPALVRPW